MEEINIMESSLEERRKAVEENTDDDGGASLFADLSSLNILRDVRFIHILCLNLPI